jgi:fumarate hydratase subunit alpha
MREIKAKDITDTVARLSKEANYYLGEDVVAALKKAREQEESPAGRQILDEILENAKIAAKEQMPLCQDCGLAVVFVEMGQDAHITGGDLVQAINEGVRKGYAEGYLRKSAVKQPFSARVNTKDNTPAIVHLEMVPGEKIKISWKKALKNPKLDPEVYPNDQIIVHRRW